MHSSFQDCKVAGDIWTFGKSDSQVPIRLATERDIHLPGKTLNQEAIRETILSLGSKRVKCDGACSSCSHLELLHPGHLGA